MSRRDEDESHNFGASVVIAETDKAIGVARPKDSGEDEFEDVPFWVPKSVLHDDTEVREKDDEGDLVTAFWWAHKGGHA